MNAITDNQALKRQTLEQAEKYLFPNRIQELQTLGVDLVIGRREGYRIWDLEGRELMDFHLNGGTYNLGHRNPELLSVLTASLDQADVGNHHFSNPERAQLAKRLAEATGLQYSVFTPSGAEANDVAIKSARRFTGRRKVVALEQGYHGRSGLSGAAGNADSARNFYSDYPDEFITVPFDDLAAMEHALAGEEQSEQIAIGWGQDPGKHSDLLINLQLEIPSFFSRFAAASAAFAPGFCL